MSAVTARRCLLGVLCLLSACGAENRFDAGEALERRAAYEVRIARDEFGVPHIHGATDADAAFGLAYAQGEDAWAVFEETLPFYRAINGRYNGAEGAVTDYLIHALDVQALIAEHYETSLAQDTRRYVQGFVDGLNYYAATHPEAVDASLLPVTPYDIVAGYVIRHLMFYGFDGVVREIMGAERAKVLAQPQPAHDGKPLGSNAIGVSPRGSDDGSTMLAINSHQPTTGPVAWYEAHIASDEGLDIQGGLFPGSPTISLGFTHDLAWAVTVNQPDLVDVYVLDINPDNDNEYRLDGEWVELEQRKVDIEVVLWGWFPWTSTQTVYRSVHGPVFRAEHGTYALRYAGAGELRQVEQWYRMNKATTFSQWRDAMRMQAFASFNFVYADREGELFFVHNSLTPKRAAGWDWSQYLPGDRSDLIWQEHLSFDALPQVHNPSAGYVHSANQTPFQVAAEADNPRASSFRPEHGFPTRMTNRAHRGLELLAQLAPISEEEFFAIKHDKAYSRFSRAYAFLTEVLELEYPPGPYADGVALLQGWNLDTHIESRGAALGTCVIAQEWIAERGDGGTPPPGDTLEACVDLLLDKVGRLDPPWGEVNRHVRGRYNLPVGGGPDTLRAIYGRGMEEDGYHTNVAGDGLYYLVRWAADGTQSVRGVHHFGSAVVDAASPHFDDQAPLYAEERLRNIRLEVDAQWPSYEP